MKKISLKKLKETASEVGVDGFKFVLPILKDIKQNMDGYANPLDFFEDLAKGGCESGVTGMFIYTQDCRKFYSKHAYDMETFMQDAIQMLGMRLDNVKGLDHAVYACWTCYGVIGLLIGQFLEDEQMENKGGLS